MGRVTLEMFGGGKKIIAPVVAIVMPAPAKQYEPTPSESGLIAWTKLNFCESTWSAIEAFLLRKSPQLVNVSIVDEHRFRQEASKRSVSLYRPK